MHRSSLLAITLIVGCGVLAGVRAAPAEALIYFSDLGPTGHSTHLGRAADDGAKVEREFLIEAGFYYYDDIDPVSDGRFLYYADPYPPSSDGYGFVRVRTDLSDQPETIVSGLTGPYGVPNIDDIAVAGGKLYWLWGYDGSQWIGRMNVDGSGANPQFLSTSADSTCDLCGQSDTLAVDPSAGFLYFNDVFGGHVFRAPLDGSSRGVPIFESPDDVRDLVAGGGYVYWTLDGVSTNGAITRSDPSGSAVDASWLPAPDAEHVLTAFAVDSGHLYFNERGFTTGGDSIGRASLSGAVETYRLFDGSVEGLAVDGLAEIPKTPLSSECKAAKKHVAQAKQKLKHVKRKLARAKARVKDAAGRAAERRAKEKERRAAKNVEKAKHRLHAAERKERHQC